MPAIYWAIISTLAGVVIAQGNSSTLFSAAKLFSGEPSPIVNLSYAQYRGVQDDKTNTSNYLGIPYAKASRFDHSQLFEQKLGDVQDVVDYGPACPQHNIVSAFAPSDLGLGLVGGFIESLPFFQKILKQDEDCLYINIQRPQDESLKGLPVLAWIHGGAFEAGSSTALGAESTAVTGIFYQGASIIKRSIEMGQPILFASFNYRLAHFGFTASREFEEAGLLNLGFEDQRNALRWIQKHIASFGGDPNKVTIMGESAGSWSVSGHLVANDGDNEGLFRAAMGLSGGPVKVDGPERQQGTFDDMGFRSLASAWTLRPDGKFFIQSPDKLAAAGRIANVPVLYGDMRDEGTLFSLINQLNLTTTEDIKEYFKTYWWPAVTEQQLNRLMELYPQDPTKGSPYGTGLLYAIPPQYKRLSSLIGDYSFEAQRRALLQKVAAPKWNYLIEASIPLRGAGNTILGPLIGAGDIPILGSFHGVDAALYWFNTLPDTISLNSHHLLGVLVSFVNHLDPNKHKMDGFPSWPQWDGENKKTMRFRERGPSIIIDDYREKSISYINEIGDSLRI
ncbi:sterol esterase carbohydrate esterase family CE10 [Beauveria brongniartii RCEF 3172]|uniref:Carboxylic ester hydrolase n=1 Tax=Beauveria brongniartii RCEF 3172 TaxID=1081107 RepID=A0A162JHB9_9HYPO|nr:sterol esterase carbohydrate esterase family CE10 [Beauveria brongniartii RCEF 3172]